MKRALGVLALTVLCLVSCGQRDDADLKGEAGKINSLRTSSFEAEEERNFAVIMSKYSQATVSPQPWAGYWWPYTDGGIASVRRDPNRLSPADKYDLAYKVYLQEQGVDVSSGYKSAAAWERMHHGVGLINVEGWWGHCDGWAAASLMVPEPREPKIINGVEFNVRDQKALLAESWLEFSSDFLGSRTRDPNDFESAAFWDVVPAQFHLALATIVGKQKKGLIFDRYTGEQVWNQPLLAYKFIDVKPEDYLGAHPEFPDVYRVNVRADLYWVDDNVDPDFITPPFDITKPDWTVFKGRTLYYELWLDAPVVFNEEGKMVRSGNLMLTSSGGRYYGGIWKNGYDPATLIHTHPDYMWVPHSVRTVEVDADKRRNPRLDPDWIADEL